VVTYRAMQDPIASPLKKTKMESASDDIIQEVSHGSLTHVCGSTPPSACVCMASVWCSNTLSFIVFSRRSVLQYVTLRTRYSELMTLTSQYITFIVNTQRRLEAGEVMTPPRSHPVNTMTQR